jgi:L-alanine-DL-glutamate epimerase-like enolase superfamily enzyme
MGGVTIRTRTVQIPVSKPTSQSTRLLDVREFVLVWIKTMDEDATGIGYTYAGTHSGPLVADVIDNLITPKLNSKYVEDIIGFWDLIYQELLMSGRRGLVLRALSAVDVALWDLKAKRAGMPLSVLLGGRTGGVPAYASGGYYRPDEGTWTEAVAAEIELNQSLGFSDHKIKVGGLPIREDAERVRVARQTVGESGRLAIDANNAYRSPYEAAEAIRAFQRATGDLGLWWVEEPLSADDIEGHAELRRQVNVPIATGEIHQTRWEFRQLMQAGAADILQPDVGVLGGVTEWLRVARAAETFGIVVAPHWHANMHGPLAAATPNCIVVEHFALEKGIYNFEELVPASSRLRTEPNKVVVVNRPGLGFEFDPDAVDRYTREG